MCSRVYFHLLKYLWCNALCNMEKWDGVGAASATVGSTEYFGTAQKRIDVEPSHFCPSISFTALPPIKSYLSLNMVWKGRLTWYYSAHSNIWKNTILFGCSWIKNGSAVCSTDYFHLLKYLRCNALCNMREWDGVGQHQLQWGAQSTLVSTKENIVHTLWKRKLPWCWLVQQLTPPPQIML